MPNFREIETLINNYSNKDWSVLGEYNQENKNNFESGIVDFITTNSKDLFIELVKYIISGNILITDKISERIDILKRNIDSSLIPDIPFESNSASILTQVSISYKNWVGYLETLNIQIIHHIDEYGSHWAVELFKENNVEDTPLKVLADYSHALNAIIKLIYIDFFLSSDVETQIPTLLIIHDRLQSQEFKRIFSSNDILRILLTEKCNLLIYKIEKANKRSYKFSLNGSEYIEHKKLHNFKHYVVDFNEKHELDSLNLTTQKKKVSTWSFKDYYVRMKVLKERTKSQDDALITYNLFNDLTDASCSFNRWAHRISKVFLHNNYTSLRLNNESITLEDINKIYIEVSANHETLGIKNYFPFQKISETLIRIINKEIATITRERIDCIVKLLEESNKSLIESYEWSRHHLHWAFQPSFDECQYKVNEVVIFTASGYSTPIDYTYVENQIQKIKEESAIAKGFSSTLTLNERILEKSKETADEKIEKLQIENRELLKKNVEVLSIFAAIVLFVVGNIQLFAQLTSLKSALLFILVFAYIISMFVLLIRLTTRNYPNIKQSLSIKDILNFNLFESLHFGIMFIATIAILMMLKCSDDIDLAKKDSNDKNGEKVLIDIKSATTNQH